MKVLFLDVDGVLNNESYWYEGGEHWSWFGGDIPFCKYSLAVLQKIVKDFDYEIVVSSSWRYDKKDLEILYKALESVGLSYIDITPDYWSRMNEFDMCRGKEIAAWVEAHPQTEEFVILDDFGEADFIGVKKHLVRTSSEKGLMYIQYKKIEEMKNNGVLNNDLRRTY